MRIRTENVFMDFAMRFMPPLSWRAFLSIFALILIGWNIYSVYRFAGIQKYWYPEAGQIDWITNAAGVWFSFEYIPMTIVPPLVLTALAFIAPIVRSARQSVQNVSPEMRKLIANEQQSSYLTLALTLITVFALMVFTTFYLIVSAPF